MTMGFFSPQYLGKCFIHWGPSVSSDTESRTYTKTWDHKPSVHLQGPLRNFKSHLTTYAPKPYKYIPYFITLMEDNGHKWR